MSDRNRTLAFTGAAALLLGLALVLHTHGSRPAARQPAPALSSPVVERTPGPAPPTSSRTVQAVGKRTVPARHAVHPEREPSRAPAVAPAEGRAAATAARAFRRVYLPYSYGRVGADRIRGAARPVVRALQEAPPRVPAAVARARPRLVSLRAQAASGDRNVLIVAGVDDGRRRYDVRLTVHHGADRWVVTEISG